MSSRKKYIRIAIVVVAAYAAVLALLIAAESNAEGSSIHTLGDAFWYSIITLTTVGYGDVSPVTPAGKALGVLLALCSLGLLTALVGVLFSFISGQARPRMRLRAARSRNWYAINEENEQSEAFARSVFEDDPQALIIFQSSREKHMNGISVVRLDCSPEDLIGIKGGPQGIRYFCMGGDARENFRKAEDAASLGIDTYSLIDLGSEELSENLHAICKKDLTSRCYWRDHPVGRGDNTIVLIGSGLMAAELLERGLLTNVFQPGRYLTYHVFGDSEAFRKSHPEIINALCGGQPQDDSLVFHEEDWEHHPEIIRDADRIIICEDDDWGSLETYRRLKEYFPTASDIHVRLDDDMEKIQSFGSSRTIFTMRSVVRDEINHLAVTLNDIYNEQSANPTAWEELSDHLKRSNIAAADHMIVKVRFLLDDDSITELTGGDCRRAYEVFAGADTALRDTCREMEHRRWMRFHQMYNWTYSPERNDLMRKHPLLIPYSELTEEEKEKDAYAWEMLAEVADKKIV